MKYAIIAAGEGSRLAAEGIQEPKPLVRVGGERLIDRLIRIFMQHDADEIVCICNDRTYTVALGHDIHGNLQRIDNALQSIERLIADRKTTLESLHVQLETAKEEFREDEFADYLHAFSQYRGDALMGVTDYIDDERPLYVQTDAQMRVTAFLDQSDDCRYISAGIYGLQPSAIFPLNNCIARCEHRMRNFQRALLSDGYKVAAWPFSKVLDIDHAGDIRKAEEMLGVGK